jgi:hypothetical protein
LYKKKNIYLIFRSSKPSNDNGTQASIHFLPRSFGVVLEKEKKKDYSESWDY